MSTKKLTISKIQLADDMQQDMHDGQVRKFSNEPYYTHPQDVARRLSEHTDSVALMCAAYLHDVFEDCAHYEPYYKVRNTFNSEVAQLVDEVTNVYTSEGYPKFSKEQRKKLENTRLLTTSLDAKILKLCDIESNSQFTDLGRLSDAWFLSKWDFISRLVTLQVHFDSPEDIISVCQNATKIIPALKANNVKSLI